MESTIAKLFHDAYLIPDQAELDRLWNEETPKRLIKFFPAQYSANNINYSLDCVLNNKVWMSSPKKFNDPFDCILNLDYTQEMEKMVGRYLDILATKPNFEQMKEAGLLPEIMGIPLVESMCMLLEYKHDLEETMYVSCFSEIENLNSLRMWAHYANNHKGICVEYDFQDVNNACSFGCIPIVYSDVHPFKDFFFEKKVHNFVNFVYVKSAEWKYEKEWRISQRIDLSEGDGFKADLATPKAIYLGCKAEARLEKEVSDFCKEKKIPLFKMERIPYRYALQAVELVTKPQ